MTTIEILGTSHSNFSSTADSSHLFNGDQHGLDGILDLNAVIAEASKAAQTAVDNGGSSAENANDLAAFLAEEISRATEQAQGIAGDTDMPSVILSATESATRATHRALQTLQRSQYQPTPIPQANSAQQQQPIYHSQQQSQAQQQYYQFPQQQSGPMQTPYQSPAATENLPPNQSGTTEMLYEKARQAAAARSSTHARREGSHSTRRPWNPEEEKALMMGLDMVKGPHWSQILSLFGPNGSVSNILADRTQVQLKDKARNLKLFFLKTNSEMPYYLQCVTGELKTRAPGQLAKQAAEERAKLNTEDEKAHINGIMALGSMQNGNGQRPNPASPAPKIPTATTSQISPHLHAHPGTSAITQPQRVPSTQAPSQVSAAPSASAASAVQLPQSLSASKSQGPQASGGLQAQMLQQPRVSQQAAHPQQPSAQHHHHQQQQQLQPPPQQQQQQQRQGHTTPQLQRQYQNQQPQPQGKPQTQLPTPQPAQPSPQQHVQQNMQQALEQTAKEAAHQAAQQPQRQSPQAPPPQSRTPPTAPSQDVHNAHGGGQGVAQLQYPTSQAPSKVEESEVKNERLNSEEAAILDLARLIQEESSTALASASAQATNS
jgi:hypothetical protein